MSELFADLLKIYPDPLAQYSRLGGNPEEYARWILKYAPLSAIHSIAISDPVSWMNVKLPFDALRSALQRSGAEWFIWLMAAGCCPEGVIQAFQKNCLHVVLHRERRPPVSLGKALIHCAARAGCLNQVDISEAPAEIARYWLEHWLQDPAGNDLDYDRAGGTLRLHGKDFPLALTQAVLRATAPRMSVDRLNIVLASMGDARQQVAREILGDGSPLHPVRRALLRTAAGDSRIWWEQAQSFYQPIARLALQVHLPPYQPADAVVEKLIPRLLQDSCCPEIRLMLRLHGYETVELLQEIERGRVGADSDA